jgi:hypothetical protein
MNTKSLLANVLIATAVLLSASGYAQQQPRWMSPEEGFIDETSDTRVEAVSESDGGGYRVELSVPKLEKPIEEVLVIGTRDPKPSLPMLHVRTEVINDADSDRSGIILYMGEKEDFVLHINYYDGTRDIVPRPVGGIRP